MHIEDFMLQSQDIIRSLPILLNLKQRHLRTNQFPTFKSLNFHYSYL